MYITVEQMYELVKPGKSFDSRFRFESLDTLTRTCEPDHVAAFTFVYLDLSNSVLVVGDNVQLFQIPPVEFDRIFQISRREANTVKMGYSLKDHEKVRALVEMESL